MPLCFPTCRLQSVCLRTRSLKDHRSQDCLHPTASSKSIPCWTLGTESGSGLAPVGNVYRKYKNLARIPKPRRCPFCKQAKGEIRKVRGGFQRVCPNCRATGPKRVSQD